jgi:hypothetical protein
MDSVCIECVCKEALFLSMFVCVCVCVYVTTLKTWSWNLVYHILEIRKQRHGKRLSNLPKFGENLAVDP